MNAKSTPAVTPVRIKDMQTCPRMKSEDLFQQCSKIEIEHRGEIYRLQITRQGKLILTK